MRRGRWWGFVIHPTSGRPHRMPVPPCGGVMLQVTRAGRTWTSHPRATHRTSMALGRTTPNSTVDEGGPLTLLDGCIIFVKSAEGGQHDALKPGEPNRAARRGEQGCGTRLARLAQSNAEQRLAFHANRAIGSGGTNRLPRTRTMVLVPGVARGGE